jgi:ankyrin repeat protein
LFTILLFSFVSHTVLFNRVMDRFKAAQRGDLQELRVVLTIDNVNDALGGRTALQWAAREGHNECVMYCIEMGANVSVRNNNGWTPLHYATAWAHVNIVRVLLDAGAMVDVASNIGWTPLYCAIRDKYVDASRLNG